MRSITEDPNISNKTILLRLDLNVPLVNGKITDTTRIDKIIPTLKYLIKQNSKIIILSHILFFFCNSIGYAALDEYVII